MAQVGLAARFDVIRLINLAGRTDRLREAAAELAAVGAPLGVGPTTRFDAVRPAEAGPFPTVGAHGCFLSQLGVLRAARDAGAAALLLLEDDVAFDQAQRAALPAALDALDRTPWSIFYGGSAVPGRPVDGLVEVPPAAELMHAHFIAFRGEALARLPAYLEAMLARPAGDPAGGPMHVDGAYNWFRREHPHLRAFAAVPAIAHQRASRTDVHALPLLDRLAVVRTVAGQLRRLKRRR